MNVNIISNFHGGSLLMLIISLVSLKLASLVSVDVSEVHAALIIRVQLSSVGQCPFVYRVFKNNFTTLKEFINLFRGHAQCFEMS
jgi:hypothetical protein